MAETLYIQFIETLEQAFGEWEKSTARFGASTYGVVSKELCVSQSQFTKLISGSATEGMYVRGIRNVERLIRERTVERENAVLQQHLQAKAHTPSAHLPEGEEQPKNRQTPVIFVVAFIVLSALTVAMIWLIVSNSVNDSDTVASGAHPLSPFFNQGFDAPFDSPYLQESEVQDYCPCSAWEGTWSMVEPFKLPLPGTRKPGLYYLAKSSDIRMKCSKINAAYVGKGRALVGYEYLVSEIWVDLDQTPLIPKFFSPEQMAYTPAFEQLTFDDHPRFRRVAVLHAFNVNNFEIYPDSIVRRAEITGRYASDIDDDLIRTFEIDLKHILRNVLGNLTKTDCQTAPNPYCDPNDLTEKESLIAFDCLYTIKAENLGLGGGYPYRKQFRLEDQYYSDNLTCGCE